MSNVHILTGCGGTGVTTLLRTLELMVEDQYWRPRLHRDIYFILIDTDRKDIQNFQRRKSELLSGLHHEPYLLVHNLAQNISHLQQPVLNNFRALEEAGERTEGRDRLLQHWWNKGPTMPFYAPWVDDIVQGAGQCGPVSFFLSWLRMPEFEKSLAGLLREIENRQGGIGPWNMLNSVIVSGLAGGTGRGCWQWIGFKMRDYFARQGHNPAPTGFLIDQSAFEDRKESRPRTATAMTVNSLTGISELSAWIKNQRVENFADAYRFRLPGFHSPANEVSDVIQPDPQANQWHGGPINAVHLIFGSNGQTHLGSAEQYFEMVGTGIYCAISNSDIRSERINDRAYYYSMASATVEVKANQIRKFFEWTARERAVARLRSGDAAAAQRACNQFLKDAKLRMGLASDDPSTSATFVAEPLSEDHSGTPLQRLLAILRDDRQTQRTALQEAFNSDDTDLVLDAANQLSRESEATVSDARDTLRRNDEEHVTESFAGVEPTVLQGPVGAALAAAKQLYEETGSVQNIVMFLQRVRLTLNGERESLENDFDIMHRDVDALVNEVSGRSFPLVGERFDEDEEKEIFSTCELQFLTRNSEHIRSYLKALYAEWIKKLRDLLSRLSIYQDSLESAEIMLHDRCNSIVPGTSEAASLLFCSEDQPEQSAIDPHSPARFYRRTLRPVMSEERIDELVKPMVAEANVLTSLISDALKPLDPDPYVQQQHMRHQRDRIIDEVTKVVRVQDDFMPREFSLRKVVTDLAKAWCRRLDGAVSADDRHYFTDLCEATLGFRPETHQSREGLQHQVPSTEDIVHHLAAVTVRNCKPYWQVRGDDLVHPFSVNLFFVTDLNKDDSEAKLNQLLQDRPVNVDVTSRTADEQNAGHNPYVLLAYSSEGLNSLESVQSVRYHEQERIEQVIKAAENPSGETIFKSGLGFISPIFVKEPRISDLRWKPWAKDLAFEENQRQARVFDVILYSLFPGKNVEDASVKSLLEKLAQHGWPMPLFELQDRNYFKVARLPRNWNDSEGVEDHQTGNLDGWYVGATVASSAGVANLLKRWEASPAWVDRILKETDQFLDHVLPYSGYGPTTPDRKEVFNAYQGWLRSEMDEADKDDPARPVWNALLQRAAHWGITASGTA